ALGPAGRAHPLALLGEPLPRLHVEVVLVAETAQQPPAPSGDLRGVEREVLVLGERQAHGPELREPARAAVLATAATHAVQPLRLVPCADLAQLDARVEQTRQVPHERPEVHALLRREVDRELAAVPLPLGVRHLHLEAVPVRALADRPPDALPFRVALVARWGVVGAGASHDLALAGRGGARRDR